MKEPHLTAADVSALRAGLLGVNEAAEARAHLTACADCDALHADLEALESELAALHPVGPMPSEVADRIDAALAAEPLVSRETTAERETETHTEGEEHEQAPTDASTPTDLTPASSPPDGQPSRPPARRWPRFALAAAGAVALLAVGSVVVQTLDLEGAGERTSSSVDASGNGDGSAAEQGEELEELEEEVRVLLAAAGDSTGELTLVEKAPDATEDDPSAPSTPSEDEEEADVLEEPGAPGEESAPGPDQDAVAVPECVASAIDRRETPLASTEDYWHDGTESYVVVLPHSADPDVVDAYVVDATCAEGTPADSGELLEMQSYERQD